MADLNYSVDINTTAGIANLQKLQDKVGTLSTKFSTLQSAVAGLFLGATIKSAVAYADAISDLSIATNIAVENILGFTDAVEQNGGSADGAQKALIKLGTSIGEAADGSDKAQNAFARVGITLTDLRNLSEKDLLAKTIKGLAAITDASKRAAAQAAIFGKSMKGVDMVGTSAGYAAATVESMKYAESVRQAGAVSDKLASAFNKFQLELLKSLAPLADFVNKLKPEQIQAFVEAIVKIGGAAAGLTVVAKAISWIITGITALTGLWVTGTGRMAAGVIAVSEGFSSLGRTIGVSLNYVDRFIRGTTQFATSNGFIKNMVTLLEKLVLRFGYVEAGAAVAAGGILAFATGVGEIALAFAGVAAIAYTVGEVIDMIFGTRIIDGFLDGVTAIWNKMKDIAGLGKEEGPKGRSYSASDVKNMNLYVEGLTKEAAAAREVTSANAAKVFSIQQGSKAYAEQNYQTLMAIQFSNTLIGKTADEIELAKAQEDVWTSAAAASKKLHEEKAAMLAALKPGESDLSAIYDAQIKKIQELATIDAARIGIAIQGSQNLRSIEKDRIQTITNITKAIEDQITRQQTLSGLMQSAGDKNVDVSFAGKQAGRSPFQQQMAQIQEDARKAALEAGRAFSASFDSSLLENSPEMMQDLIDGLKDITAAYQGIAAVQTENLEASRTWEAGWKTAFDSYTENATNAATKAGEVFSAITSNMNSAIDNFVDNGKFSFKDFATSIIQDMLKIELKAQASQWMKLLSGGAGGGGILSSIASVFGFADGGNPPVGKASIVGEKGPELFIPKTAGTIVPNNKLGTGGGGGSNVTHNTYVTNNVSAIDSRGVAEFFASNRKMMLGTMQMAQKELPYNNR